MALKTMPATMTTRCPVCEENIHPGEEIVELRDPIHADCAHGRGVDVEGRTPGHKSPE